MQMKTPVEVLESLNLTGTDREQVSQRLAAIRAWLETPEGQAYVAALSTVPADCDHDFFESVAPLSLGREYQSVSAVSY
jgi:hypothetical protein